jgi:glycosyltransferase involved in cell wall biosynthesis
MKLSVITPCYNNAGSIEELMLRIQKVTQHPVFQSVQFEYIFVDDGSSDHTWEKLKAVKNQFPEKTKLIKLTRNFGSYNSFLAGMTYASGDANVYLHADLQDPPELIPQLYEYYLKGFKLVIANRCERADSSIFSSLYHAMIKTFGIRNIPPGGFDLILFDAEIRKQIVAISEKNTNNVYLISWLGYPYVNIPYRREARKHGKSMWTLRKKIRLFVDTVFSFTNIPIWIIRIILLLTMIYFVVSAIFHYLKSESIFLSMQNAVVLAPVVTLLWIIGEYLDRIHESVRKRPNFVVEHIE